MKKWNDWGLWYFVATIALALGVVALFAPHIPEPEPPPPTAFEIPALMQSRTTTVHVILTLDLENVIAMYAAEDDNWRILIDGQVLEATAAGETGRQKP